MIRPFRSPKRAAGGGGSISESVIGNGESSSALSVFIESLLPILSDTSILEVYLSSNRGVLALNCKRDTVSVDLGWDQNKIAEFLLELAWHCKVRIDPFKPFAGGVVPWAPWRWHAVIPPFSPEGPLVVLRRQLFGEIDLSDFVFENFEKQKIADWVQSGVSLITYGATGSGKTTFMVAVLREFYMSRRVGLAESVAEIPLLSEKWFRLVEVPVDTGGRGGVSFSTVVAEMMRLSPELLVMGELRGSEAAMFVDFARTGHGGVMTTLHAGNISDARNRIAKLSGLAIDAMPPTIGLRVWRDGNHIIRVRMDQINII